MTILKDVSLKPYNTFGIDVKASHFISTENIDDLRNVLSSKEYPNKFILGGGSNMLLTKNIDALVIHVNLKGIEILSKEDNHVTIKASAGENWHDFVLWCLQNNFGGLENMSLIPGNVGTAPIQNIGAYGVELKDSFVSCETIHIDNLTTRTFTKEDCNFGYRNSVFKQDLKGQYIITSVTFKLSTTNHNLKTNYGAITNELESLKVSKPTIQDISKAVINIRSSKLPDPKLIGNSGSFFKNPVIKTEHFNKLKENFPEIPSYPASEKLVKVPAGWLIEKAGFKGKTFNNYGVHKNQALVLVNYGGANGNDILNLSKLIQNTIQKLFGINLEAEVNII